MHRIAFDSPYNFGDLVRFDSVNGKGEGTIIDITLSDDGAIYYAVQIGSDDNVQPGIYPDEIELVREGKK
jgi:hypothetical protein